MVSFVNAQKIGVKHLCPEIKTAGRNMNNLTYADDRILMAVKRN